MHSIDSDAIAPDRNSCRSRRAPNCRGRYGPRSCRGRTTVIAAVWASVVGSGDGDAMTVAAGAMETYGDGVAAGE